MIRRDFQLLGDFQTWHDGHLLDLGGRRQRCVLAVLLLPPRQAVSVRRIVACAWPPNPPATAERPVTGYVSRLRRVVRAEPEVDLPSRPPGCLIDLDPALVDVHRFNALIQQARGDPDGADEAQAALGDLGRSEAG